MENTATNPVIRTIDLHAFPGWEVREYADGTYDAVHVRGAISPALDTFGQAVAHVRQEERRDD